MSTFNPPPGGVEAATEVLTVREAALILRLNLKTLYALLKAGKGPKFQKCGRSIRLSRAALIDWLSGKPAF